MKVFKPHPNFQALDQDWRQKWADALRSGEYEQGNGYLEMNNRFCCLGVLQKIHGLPTKDGNGNAVTFANPRDCVIINNQVAEDLYISTLNGFDRYASVLNDDDELTFPQIADLIMGKEVTTE